MIHIEIPMPYCGNRIKLKYSAYHAYSDSLKMKQLNSIYTNCLSYNEILQLEFVVLAN